MARPREFETQDALERAMQVFWQHGYKDASLPDLLDGMGLTRGSLYKAFKDKKSLYLLVLDRYETTQVDTAVRLLSDPDIADGRQRILTLFSAIVAAVNNGDQRGCLLCSAAGGAAVDDPDIAKVVHGGLLKMQSAFEVALDQSPTLAGLGQAGRAQLADVMLTQYIGLRTLARSRLPLGILERSVRGIKGILGAAC